MFDGRNYFKPNLKRSLQGAIVCLIEQRGFKLTIKNAKEKDDCENNRLFLSGLSKKDVFADFFGSFEPTKPKFFRKSVINTNLYPILFNFCLKDQENTTKLHIYSLN